MPTVTPEQTRLVLDNIGVARQVAKRHSRGQMLGHYDDILSVALVRLCEIAIEGDKRGDFEKHAYWQCHYACMGYIHSRAGGKVNGTFPILLGGMEENEANELVEWSLNTFGIPSGNARPPAIHPGVSKGYNRLKTHCPMGHEYSTENTYVTPAGGRKCKTCSVAATIKCRDRKKANAKTQN